MTDVVDVELGGLIDKLSNIQNEVGGKKKTVVIGSDGKADRFMEIKSQMVERLQTIRELMQTTQGKEHVGANAKDVIGGQNKIRQEMLELNDELLQLENLFKLEAKKKKSKYTGDEMSIRRQILTQFQQEIQAIKDFQRTGYVKQFQPVNMTTMEESEMFKGRLVFNPITGAEENGTRGVFAPAAKQEEITDNNRFALQQIKDRDRAIDDEIVRIGVGIDELRDIAVTQRDEVKLQNKMLESLEQKVDGVLERNINVNARMKTTLDAARKADKICMDIFCVIILVGMIIVLVKLTTQ